MGARHAVYTVNYKKVPVTTNVSTFVHIFVVLADF